MNTDGITISTAAITALLGGGGIGYIVSALRSGRKCDRCPDHKQHDQRISELEKGVSRIEAKLDMLIDIQKTRASAK